MEQPSASAADRPDDAVTHSDGGYIADEKQASPGPSDGNKQPYASSTIMSSYQVNEEEKRMICDRMNALFKKMITDIEGQVLTVSESQCELDSQLDRLIATLDNIEIDEKLTDEITNNNQRISSLKSRLTLVHTILSNSSARCSRTLAACGAAVSSMSAQTSSISSSSAQCIPSDGQSRNQGT